MRVLVLHNELSPHASAAERDVLVQVDAVSEALRQNGHEPVVVPVSLDLRRFREHLEDRRPEVAFNLVESLHGSDRLGFLVTAVLDVLGCPYTGSSTEAVFQSGDKLKAKARMRRAGLPTPDWIPRRGDSRPGRDARRVHVASVEDARYILKPLWEHASFGVDAGAVVDGGDLRSLRRQLSERERSLGTPCFAERYVEGREFNLSVLAAPAGPQVLPPAEIEFFAYGPEMPRIVDQRAKWDADSFEYQNTPRSFQFPAADRPLLARLSDLARCCWRLFGLGGYARVDFRVDRGGRPWILEVNPNPCLSPDAGFAAALDEAGIAFPDAVQQILDDANRPLGRPGGSAGEKGRVGHLSPDSSDAFSGRGGD